MARDGSGTYTLPEAAYVDGTTITADAMNSNLSDIGSALSQSLSKDGQTASTANQPMGGFRHTGTGAAAARTDYARTDQAQDSSTQYALTTGNDTILATLTPAITAYAIGQTFQLKKAAGANTTAVTLNINSVGAGAVTWPDGTALAAGDLPANCIFTVSVQATTPVFHLQSAIAPPGIAKTTVTTRGDLIYRNATVPARLAIGATGTVLKSDGTDPSWGTVLQAVRIQTFTATGTYTPHAKMLYCQIEAVGGGGGGGGVEGDGNAMAGAGGGSGAYSRKIATAADIGASQAVTIGAAGTAGSAGNNNGGNGGDTSVGTLCIANGGAGGQGQGPLSDTSQGGLGGVTAGSAGDVAVTGSPGSTGMYAVLASALGWSGSGGSSYLGGGGRGVMVDGASTAGGAGQNYGGGGAGGSSRNSVTNAAGGAGAAGYVVITEYCSS
jgi:hypothetical protein